MILEHCENDCVRLLTKKIGNKFIPKVKLRTRQTRNLKSAKDYDCLTGQSLDFFLLGFVRPPNKKQPQLRIRNWHVQLNVLVLLLNDTNYFDLAQTKIGHRCFTIPFLLFVFNYFVPIFGRFRLERSSHQQ